MKKEVAIVNLYVRIKNELVSELEKASNLGIVIAEDQVNTLEFFCDNIRNYFHMIEAMTDEQLSSCYVSGRSEYYWNQLGRPLSITVRVSCHNCATLSYEFLFSKTEVK